MLPRRALTDVLLLVLADKLDERRAEYPGIEVRPLKFATSELQASHWRFGAHLGRHKRWRRARFASAPSRERFDGRPVMETNGNGGILSEVALAVV